MRKHFALKPLTSEIKTFATKTLDLQMSSLSLASSLTITDDALRTCTHEVTWVRRRAHDALRQCVTDEDYLESGDLLMHSAHWRIFLRLFPSVGSGDARRSMVVLHVRSTNALDLCEMRGSVTFDDASLTPSSRTFYARIVDTDLVAQLGFKHYNSPATRDQMRRRLCTKDGDLSLRCVVSIAWGVTETRARLVGAKVSLPQMVACGSLAALPLQRDMEELFLDGASYGGDTLVQLTCERTLVLHRCILMSRVPHLRSAFFFFLPQLFLPHKNTW